MEVIDSNENSSAAGANGGAGEKTVDCCDYAAVKKFELCESAGVEIVELAGARALMVRVNSVSMRTNKASSEMAEFSEEYVDVNSLAKEATQRAE